MTLTAVSSGTVPEILYSVSIVILIWLSTLSTVQAITFAGIGPWIYPDISTSTNA